MKLLDNKTTPTKELSPITELADKITELTKVQKDEVLKILSGYTIKRNNSQAILETIPNFKIGDKIHITRKSDEENKNYSWDFTGEVVDIWYRGVPYDSERIGKALENIENKEYIGLTIYQEMKPTIYHRIVLNDNKKGILIVPCVKGTNIVLLEE